MKESEYMQLLINMKLESNTKIEKSNIVFIQSIYSKETNNLEQLTSHVIENMILRISITYPSKRNLSWTSMR